MNYRDNLGFFFVLFGSRRDKNRRGIKKIKGTTELLYVSDAMQKKKYDGYVRNAGVI